MGGEGSWGISQGLVDLRKGKIHIARLASGLSSERRVV